MRFGRIKWSESLEDEYDSVSYGQNNIKKYWEHERYRFSERSCVKLWSAMDYDELLDNQDKDVAKLIRLLKYLTKYGFIQNKSRKPATEKDLYKLMKLNKDSGTAQKFVRKLFKKKIIKEDTITNRIYVNPLVSMRDDWLHIDCYRVFRKELQPYLKDKDRARENLEKHLKELYGDIPMES